MTRRTNARLAGITFLAYIAIGITAMALFGRATPAPDIPGMLAGIVAHLPAVRVSIVLELLTTFCALTLGVTLYALTRDEDADLALLGLTFRVAEGVVGAVAVQRSVALLWLTSPSAASTLSGEGIHTLAVSLLKGQGAPVGAILFAMGSLLFAWLFLRGRMIPVGLAWLGVVASVAWLVVLPLQLVGVLHGTVVIVTYALMAVFEVVLAGWLIVRGAALPARAH